MSARAARVETPRPLPVAWGMTHQQQVAGFHRERDPGRLLAMARTLVSAGVLVGLVLGVVGVRLHQVRLSYRLDGLRTIRAELEESRSRLRVEIDTLSSLARIEGKARTELGMAPPASNQVQLAREFLSRGDGSTTTPLTASAGERSRSVSGAR
ncbi:MAG TPA: cell division protein FtsL [Candidatus Methylomirabilis sp.]|nr:cell division protein FtsL [Candidatus Methylomirabilis sp.]